MMKKRRKAALACTLIIALSTAGCGTKTEKEPMAGIDAENDDSATAEDLEPGWLDGLACGDEIVFGCYEQDMNYDNGPEQLKWTVIAEDSDSITLITTYIIDNMPFNAVEGPTSWAESTLRFWLNNEFKNLAFSPEEQSVIKQVSNHVNQNKYYGTPGGDDTEDDVWLIGEKLAEEFHYQHLPYGTAVPTAYAFEAGNDVSKNYGTGYWWIAFPGFNTEYEALMSDRGSHNDGGTSTDGSLATEAWGVRPCIRINRTQKRPETSPDAGEIYEVDSDTAIGWYEAIVEMESPAATSIDAIGFETADQAVNAIMQILVDKDLKGYLMLVPWPVFTGKYSANYVRDMVGQAIAYNNNDQADARRRISGLYACDNKEAQIDYLLAEGYITEPDEFRLVKDTSVQELSYYPPYDAAHLFKDDIMKRFKYNSSLEYDDIEVMGAYINYHDMNGESKTTSVVLLKYEDRWYPFLSI